MTNDRIAHRWAAPLSLCFIIATAIGCHSGRVDVGDPTVLPEPFAVDLYVKMADGRAAMYRVDREGVLHFGGGRSAHAGGARRVGPLHRDQLLRVWRTIVEHGLLDAGGSFLDESERVRYRFTVRAGGRRHRLEASDGEAPGLAPLADLLFGYQSGMRYGEVLSPIEAEIERRREP